MNLPTMRTRVRRDLHDEDATAYRWTDNELDRHIQRALDEVSVASPVEAKATLTTTAGSRDLSLSSLTGLIAVEAVEYPTGKYPPSYVRFSLWASALTLLVDAAPTGAESVWVFHGKLHTLDATTSTLPSSLEDLVATGAAAYAALEWSSFATNRVNVGGEEVWRQYLTWGQDRMAAFLRRLTKLGQKHAVRVRSLYTPSQPRPSQSTDWGP
ncbi:MAG: hypothetical protein HY535_06965 [Chloroflexi bacterium]|nr:hypothetical protein [Chloroflexota bacterium]